VGNKISFKSSFSPKYELTGTGEGDTFTKYSPSIIGTVAAEYETSSTLGNDDVVKYTGIVEATTSTVITSALLAGYTTEGTSPSSVMAYYVKYLSRVGTPSVYVYFGSTTVHAVLSPGQGVCIPLFFQNGINCKIKATTYEVDVNEATVEVVLAGL